MISQNARNIIMNQAQQGSNPPQKSGFHLRDLLPAAGAVGLPLLADLLTGGLALPANIGLSSLGGGLGKVAQNKIEGKGLTEGVAGQSALGGAGAIGGELLGTAGRALGIGVKPAVEASTNAIGEGAIKTGDNILQKLGNAGARSVVNPKIPPSATAPAEIQGVIDTLRGLGFKGSSANQYSQLQPAIAKLGNQIEGKFATSNPVISIPEINAALTKSANETGELVLTNSADKRAFNAELTNLNEKLGQTPTAKDIYEYKKALNSRMPNTFAALEKGATLTPKQAAQYAIWKSLDEVIGTNVPEVNSLIKTQGVLYKSAPGLAKASERSIKIPLLGASFPGGANLSSGITDLLGRGATRSGNNVAQGSTILGKTLANTAAQTGIRSVANSIGGSTTNGQQGNEDLINSVPSAPQSSSGGLSNQALALLLLSDLQRTGGKNITALTAIGKLLQPDTTNGQPKLSAAQQTHHDNVLSALNALDNAEQNLVNVGGAKGALGFTADVPLLGQYLNSGGTAYQKTKVDLASQLGKAISGSSRVPEAIFNRVLDSLPSVTDTPQQASQKLQFLRSGLLRQAGTFGFNDILDQYGAGNGSSNQQDTIGSLLSSLGQQ